MFNCETYNFKEQEFVDLFIPDSKMGEFRMNIIVLYIIILFQCWGKLSDEKQYSILDII